MAEYLIQEQTLSNIADAIREKTGMSAAMYPDHMPGYIRNIQTGSVNSAGIPEDIAAEAERVASGINSKKAANGLTFIAMSDMHELGDNDVTDAAILERYRRANLNAGQAAKLISDKVALDFFANLGDLAWGDQNKTPRKETISSIIRARGCSFDVHDQMERFFTPGNHDARYYGGYLDAELTESLIGSYRYVDFADKKIRVICLNTADISDGTEDSERVSGEQLQWFAQALDLSSKTDAAQWGIIALSHHPMDWGAVKPLADCLGAYLNGTAYSATHDGIGVSYNYAGKNAAEFIANFHGHVHCFNVSDISGTTAKRVAIPNACYGRNNEYGSSGNMEFGEAVTYTKSDNSTAQNTAFCVVTLDRSDKTIYADCFGAGYDRIIGYGVAEVVTYSVTNNLTGAKNSNGSTVVKAGTAYTADISALVGYALQTITVSMGGVDITDATVSGSGILIPEVTGDVVITVTTTVVEDFVYGEFTNLVPASEERDSSAVYNGIGYKNDTYPSETDDGSAAGIVCTGWIPYTWSPDNALYIKGATLDTGNNYVRIYGFNSKVYVNGSVGYTGGTKINERFAVEILGDQYYKVTPLTTAPATLTHIRISLVGTGEHLIVTVNEPIHAEGSVETYSVTQNLDAQISSGNTANVVMAGSSWTTTLTTAAGYEIDAIAVTMGNTDITGTVVSGNIISIPAVTGNIVVTATAKSGASYNVTNLVPVSQAADSTDPYNGVGYKNGVYCSSSGGDSTDAACVSTGFIPYTWKEGNTLYIRGAAVTNESHVRIYGYSAKTGAPTSSSMCSGSTIDAHFTLEELETGNYYKLTHKVTVDAVNYLRLSLIGTGENLFVTVNEPIL